MPDDVVSNNISVLKKVGSFAHADAGLVVAEWTDGGGGQDPPLLIAPRHRHLYDEEWWYVLDGELAFELEGHVQRASTGTAVVVPPGTIHTWWNPRPEPCRYLIIMPRRIAELVDAIHTRRGDFASIEAMFRAYDAELVDAL